MKTYPLYIDGQDVEGTGWTCVVDAAAFLDDKWAAFRLKRSVELGRAKPEGKQVIACCARGDAAHNNAAVRAARRAQPGFAALPQAVRSRIVVEFNNEIVRRSGELIDILVAEGHPRRLAAWEVSGMARGCDEDTVRWYERQLHSAFDTPEGRLELVRKPDGVVCVNPPQNAAGSNSGLGVLALLAGNTLVVKAPRSCPLGVFYVYREILAPILDRHGAPPGTLNIVSGNSSQILQDWVESPLVNDILFFGDSQSGLKVGEACFSRGKKAILELAGNDGLVVWRDADLDAAARALEETFYGSGQICMVPKYAVVHPAVADEFIPVFLDRVAKLAPGYPNEADVLLSPVLKVDKFVDFLAEARGAGADVLCGGNRVELDGSVSPTGMFCEPTVVRVDGLAVADSLSCVREETFFPLLPIVVPEAGSDAGLLDRIIAFVNANKYGLRNSLWTGDDQVARRFAAEVCNGGQLRINASHIGFVSYISTHGGTGRTGGPYGELNYVGLRTSHYQGITWGDGNPRPLDDRVLLAQAAG